MASLKVTYDGFQHCTALAYPQGKTAAMDCPYTGKGEELSPANMVGSGLAGCMLISMGTLAIRDEIDITGATVEGEQCTVDPDAHPRPAPSGRPCFPGRRARVVQAQPDPVGAGGLLAQRDRVLHEPDGVVGGARRGRAAAPHRPAVVREGARRRSTVRTEEWNTVPRSGPWRGSRVISRSCSPVRPGPRNSKAREI